MKETPPEREAETISDDAPAGCPDGHVCYSEKDHAIIERGFLHLKKVERWASLTWTACKPSEQ